MKLLDGKVAVITGGSDGNGKGIVKADVKNVAHVEFTYHSASTAADKIVADLSSHGVKVKAYQSNAADHEEAQELVKQVLEDFETIDILVNNAGITKDNLLMRMSEEDFDSVIEVNLKSVFNMRSEEHTSELQSRGQLVWRLLLE